MASRWRAEAVEARLPHPAVRRQPVVELDQRLDAQRVPAPGPVDPDGHEPGVAQHPQVLGRQRLGEAERLGELADEVRSPSRRRSRIDRRIGCASTSNVVSTDPTCHTWHMPYKAYP